ncbi:copper oxidase [uncultured Gimesia sp.]|uniref:multicopper oxidase family protein n=1 Tax=uncultured Gimesia sp. TaxID=1678688 RepID=UPI0030D7C944
MSKEERLKMDERRAMETPNDRRNFLVQGAAATAGLFAAGSVMGQQPETASISDADVAGPQSDDGYPRMHPGLGGPIGSPTDRGKLVSGLRNPGLPPVNVVAPDLTTTSGKMVDGVREFHLRATPVRREVLPGIWMNAYGYNDQFPSPVLELYQGDRVRIVFKNELPEPTSLHSHGLELPVYMDGVPGVTQSLIQPGDTFVYEYDVHQEGTYFLHSHVAMQEAIGMVVPFIIHPKVAYNPVVDRDFVLVTQQFSMMPHADIPNTQSMDWNFITANGRCGPFTTPLVCKLGERVRIRFINYSTLHQHPMHLHGHTYWVTGTEGGRIPEPAWVPGNTVILGVAQARDVEFIANNHGDWVLHCHMFHHMMNHMVSQVGPIIRQEKNKAGFEVPGFPQMMSSAKWSKEELHRITSRRETQGMREGWYHGVKGLFTVLRVLPPELYDKVMHTNDPIPPNSSTPLNPPPGIQTL